MRNGRKAKAKARAAEKLAAVEPVESIENPTQLPETFNQVDEVPPAPVAVEVVEVPQEVFSNVRIVFIDANGDADEVSLQQVMDRLLAGEMEPRDGYEVLDLGGNHGCGIEIRSYG